MDQFSLKKSFKSSSSPYKSSRVSPIDGNYIDASNLNPAEHLLIRHHQDSLDPQGRPKDQTVTAIDSTRINKNNNSSSSRCSSSSVTATATRNHYGNHVSADEIAVDIECSDNEDSRHGHGAERKSFVTSAAPFEISKELRVSFDVPGSNSPDSSPESSMQSTKKRGGTPERRVEEVLRCTSNASFQRRSSLLSRVKTRSRLQDPNVQESQRLSGWIGKSGQLKSGMMAKTLEDEEDDPLADDDLPEEYRRFTKFNALTLIQWFSLFLIVSALICSLSIRSWKQKTLWDLRLWKWEVFLLVLICGRLVSGWGIRLIVFFIERNFLLRKRVLYFVYGLRKAVQNCCWLGLVLLTWHLLFDKKVEGETNSKFLRYVTKILWCFLVGNLLWLLKTLMVKVLASSFHVSTYFDRIQESIFNQYVIEALSGPPMAEIQGIEEEEENIREEVSKLEKAGAVVPPELSFSVFPPAGNMRGKKSFMANHGLISRSKELKSIKLPPGNSTKNIDDGIPIDHLHKLNHKNISAWNMKRLINIVRHGSLSTLDEQLLDNPNEDESTRKIRSENEAKSAARKIFKSVARNGARYIYWEDLLRFLREDEALKTMTLFEGAIENKRISKSSLKNWLVNAFRERRALALTLNDTKTAVNKLHQMVNVIASILIAVIWLLILEIATTKFLLFVTSQLLLVVFIFGNTCKTIFESIIFLFVIHPYDVGDRCEIDGAQMVVEEMNILTTIFLRYDNLKITYPNSVLWQKPISNFYRSPEMGDAIEFCVHISTPAEKIAAIKQRISSYIESKKEHWFSNGLKIVCKDVEEMNKVRFAVWISHVMNHQDMGERWSRRALLVEELTKILNDLDLLHPLDVNLRTSIPLHHISSPLN